MTNQKLSAAQREALFRAHDGKCFYTRAALSIGSFQVDHIIPEKLLSDPERLREVKAALQLPDNFDLLGFENLVPAAPERNLQKSDIVFNEHDARYYLALAREKKARVEEELAKIERRNTGGKALVLLQEALESGKLSPDDVARILEEHQEQPEAIFRLLEEIAFADSGYVREIAKDDIESLRDRPVFGARVFGGSDGLTLTHNSLGKKNVRTCREYDQAIGDGYYPYTTFDIKGAALFKHRSGLLRALEKATPAERSFINSPRVGIADLHLLPYRLFPNISPDLTEEELSGSYQDKLSGGSMVVKKVRQNSITVESNYMGQHIVEVARGDFDGDGIEDILLFEYAWATGGTLGFGGIRVFTRKSVDGMFEEVAMD
jgi:hypothetical protein